MNAVLDTLEMIFLKYIISTILLLPSLCFPLIL